MKRISKTERITILGTPEFKAFLALEAEKSGISVSELVRARCVHAPSSGDDVDTLEALAGELSRAVADARQALEVGMASVREALAARGAA